MRLRGDFQNPPKPYANRFDIAIGLPHRIANGIAAQGIDFLLLLRILISDAVKTIGALIQHLLGQGASLADILDPHSQRIICDITAQGPFGNIASGIPNFVVVRGEGHRDGLDILWVDPLRLDLVDDLLRRAGIFTRRIGSLWPLRVDPKRNSRDIGHDLRARFSICRDSGHRVFE
jgi:hypothetical protein